MSVAISSNIPEKKEAVCFIFEGEEGELVKKMLDYLEELSDWAYEILCEKFRYVFEALELSPNFRKENVTKEFDSYLCGLIVLGYNSSNYDLNLIKPKLIRHLVKKLVSCLKKQIIIFVLKQTNFGF